VDEEEKGFSHIKVKLTEAESRLREGLGLLAII